MNTKTFAIVTKRLVIGLFATYALKVISEPARADEAVTQSSAQIVTISSILDNPVEGQEVTLRGQILSQQAEETDYVFTDGTNEIVIQLQEDDFSYSPDIVVEILGIVDFESQHADEVAKDPTPEDIQINVSQLQVVTAK